MSADKFDVIIVGAGLPGSILQRWRSSVASRKRASRAGCSWPTIRTFGSKSFLDTQPFRQRADREHFAEGYRKAALLGA